MKPLLKTLENVLSALASSGLFLKIKKCAFLYPSIKYLGFLVSKEGIAPLPSRVRAIASLRPPTSKKALISFLATSQYLRHHVPRFAELSYPLRHLTKKGTSFHWGEEEQRAIDIIKDEISKKAGILGQYLNDQYVPIAYYSWGLSSTQRNWDTREKELFVFKKTLEAYG